MDNATPIVYADESGNSGSNFMRLEEPLFLSVSTSLRPDEALHLLLEAIGPTKRPEYKYESVSRARARHPSRIAGLGRLMNAVAARPDAFAAHVIHKRFALICIWADVWIYPYTAAHGWDPREDGSSRVLPVIISEDLPEVFLNRLLRAFQEMMTARSEHDARVAANKLFRVGREGPPIRTRDRDWLLGLMIESIFTLGPARLRSVDRLAMDVALPALQFTASTWKRRLRQPWILCHDKSAHLERHRDLWSFLSSTDVGSTSFPSPAGMVEFPLDVEETRFERSVDNPSIQLCDVVAGVIRDRLYMTLDRPVDLQIKKAIGHINPDAVVQSFVAPDRRLVVQHVEKRLPAMREGQNWLDARLSEFEARKGAWTSRW